MVKNADVYGVLLELKEDLGAINGELRGIRGHIKTINGTVKKNSEDIVTMQIKVLGLGSIGSVVGVIILKSLGLI